MKQKRERRTFTVEQLESLLDTLNRDEVPEQLNGALTLEQLNLTIDALEYLVDYIHQQKLLSKKQRLKTQFIMKRAKEMYSPDEMAEFDREVERRLR